MQLRKSTLKQREKLGKLFIKSNVKPNVKQKEMDSYGLFMIAKRTVKTNQDFIGEQCIRNDDGVLAVSGEDRKIHQKNYHQKLLNIEFVCDKNSKTEVDIVNGPRYFLEQDIVGEAVSKMKNGIPSVQVSEMVK